MPRHIAFESPVTNTLKGIAAGLVGTLVMTTALQAVDRFARGPEAIDSEPPEAPASAPGGATESAVPTERVAERIANRVFGTELSHSTRQRLGLGIYWTYGAFWGALSAQLQETIQPPALVYGTVLGLSVWLIGPMRLIPALRLYERPPSSSLVRRGLAIALHLLYGLTTAFTYRQLAGER